MAGANELGLADLFKESNVKIQSSTIYKALRGDGMRVRPLAKSRSAIGKSLSEHVKSESRPGSYRPEKGRVAAIKNMFELKAMSSNESKADRRSSKPIPPFKPPVDPRRSSPKKVSAFIKRELTPVSESSTQRVPFRSTKLERPVSRASLKEDESEKKPKNLRRTTDNRALQRKGIPLFDALTKGKEGPANGDSAKTRASISHQNRLGTKRRVMKRKRLGVTRRATVVAGRPVITSNEPPLVPRKEEPRKYTPGPKPSILLQRAATVLNARAKIKVTPTPSVELSRAASLPKTTLSKKTARTTVARAAVKKPTVVRAESPVRKQLWIPTETRDSYNLYCPDTKAKRMKRTQRVLKKKTGTAQTVAGSKFENTSEESSETDDEEARMLEAMRRRRELKRKSLEFFSQFRYGEMVRKSMPDIRYTSEITAKSEAEVKRRLTETEIRMRLSRLEESVSKISGLVPKWSSMLSVTKDTARIESIQKTLTNSEKILEGKVDKARTMLEKYLTQIKNDGFSPPTEEMDVIDTHSHLVQLEMDSLERMFEYYEKQLQEELEEPTSISL